MFNKKAFSLSELMVVIAVSAILMAVAVPTFIGARNRSNATACRANLEIINSALKEWALDNPDIAVGNYAVTVGDINAYIDGEFSSLEEPTTGSAIDYVTDDGDSVLEDTDIVVTLADGSIPNPTCNTGLAGHTL